MDKTGIHLFIIINFDKIARGESSSVARLNV